MKILNKFGFDIQFVKFVIVGVINTLFGSAIMFGMYNFLGCDYYLSSFCNYFFGSILSYFLNKYFTFNYKKKSIGVIIRFILNISVCYLIAYGVAKPLVAWILAGNSKKLIENIAMMVGMGLFVICNYFGQKLIVFTERKEKNEEV